MKHDVTILDAINDPKLFAPWFAGKKRKSFENWFCFLQVLFALGPLTPEQLAVYQQCTGRTAPPATPAQEAWLQIGRRGGKSFVLALITTYLACFREYRQYLAPGERGTIVIIAQDRKAARSIFRFVKGLLHGVPMLKRMIEREISDTFDLNNRISIEIHVASFRSSRGYTVIAALCDEIAFWRSEESANPDKDILNSLRPAMATIPGSIMLCASSPYAQRGEMWNANRRHFGKQDSPVLYWIAPTRTMNPSVPQRVIDQAFEDDAASAMAEYGAEFRTDADDFLSRAVVDAATVEGRHELQYVAGRYYLAFVDCSGGGSDSMTLAVAHVEGNKIILDLVREVKAPFSPDAVTEQFCAIIKAYGLTDCFGDNYAKLWPVERFAQHGVSYNRAVLPKSDIYLHFLPLINSHRVELLDHSRLASQLCGLQRYTVRGGRDTVDHIPGHNFHDDVCNAACGAIVYAAQRAAQRVPLVGPIIFGGPHETPIPGPRLTAEQQQAVVTYGQLEEQRHQLASRRDICEQQRKRCADDSLIHPAARAQLEELTGELVAIGVEQANVDAALAKTERPPEPGSTPAYYEWFDSGGGGPPGGWTRNESI